MTIDSNKRFINDFDDLLRICNGDHRKAEKIRSILRKSHRNERAQIYRDFKYRDRLIGNL